MAQWEKHLTSDVWADARVGSSRSTRPVEITNKLLKITMQLQGENTSLMLNLSEF